MLKTCLFERPTEALLRVVTTMRRVYVTTISESRTVLVVCIFFRNGDENVLLRNAGRLFKHCYIVLCMLDYVEEENRIEGVVTERQACGVCKDTRNAVHDSQSIHVDVHCCREVSVPH